MLRINWREHHDLLVAYDSEKVARIIGCHASSVKQYRKKAGIPSPGRPAIRRNRELDKRGKRWCPECEMELPRIEFGKRGDRGCAAYCYACARQRAKTERRRRKNGRAILLQRKLGENKHVYDQLILEQGGVCAICGEDNGDKALVIDHDHETNRLRGLLCQKCNSGLGILGDTESALERALKYVRQANQRTDLPTLRD